MIGTLTDTAALEGVAIMLVRHDTALNRNIADAVLALREAAPVETVPGAKEPGAALP